MGNCTANRKDLTDYSFTPQEIENMKLTFLRISTIKERTLLRKTLSKEGLKKQMPENPGLAVKLYHWMRTVSETYLTTFETFVGCMQVLTKEAFEYQIELYKHSKFDKFEVFLQISLGHYKSHRDDILLSSISYTQVLTFFKEIFNMFNAGIAEEHSTSIAPKILAASVFRHGQSSISWKDFVLFIRLHFPYLNHIIKTYFTNRFIDQSLPIHLPVVSETPTVLNTELLSLFCLTNSSFQNLPKLHLLYSTAKQGKNFNSLASALKGYNGPTLILIRHTEGNPAVKNQIGRNQQATYVCGGFTKTPWKDETKYTGTGDTVLFSLIPRFKLFSPRPDGNQHFTYLNTKHGSRVGLGFGGKDYGNFKLWIDENIALSSYTNEDDGTYESGYLVEPHVNKLNIDQIEIWGLGGESTLTKQQEFRKTETLLRTSINRDSLVESKIMTEESYQENKNYLYGLKPSVMHYEYGQQNQAVPNMSKTYTTAVHVTSYEKMSPLQRQY